MSQAYYRAHAAEYAAATANLLPDEALRRFVEALGPRPHAHLIDAGCGSGRDAAWLLARGYTVDAFDACAELCAQARERFGVAARVASILELDLDGVADGVWASASLVHMPPDEVRDALGRLVRAVRPGGVLYASVKEGQGSAVDGLGRTFHYWDAQDFERAVCAAGPVALVARWTNAPSLDLKGQGFVNVLVRRGA